MALSNVVVNVTVPTPAPVVVDHSTGPPGPAGEPQYPTVPFNAGNLTGSVTLNRTTGGAFQKASVTGNVTLLAPTGGTEGLLLRLWLTPTGADRTLTLDASIKMPSDSGLSLPKTLTQNKLYIVQFAHNGTDWMLTSFVGGY